MKRVQDEELELPQAKRIARNKLPTSSSQLYYRYLSAESTSHYNVAAAAQFEGKDTQKICKMIQNIFSTTDILRAHWEKESLYVKDLQSFTIPLKTFEIKDSNVEELLLKDIEASFDLNEGPLCRFTLISTPNKHILLVVLHRTIADYHSAVTLLRLALEETSLNQMVDYSCIYNSTNGTRGKVENYWKDRLGGSVQIAQLPLDRSRPSEQKFECSFLSYTIGNELSKKILNYSKSINNDPSRGVYLTLITAFKILIHRLTGEEDISVGSVRSGRTTPNNHIIGPYEDHLVLRTFIGDDLTFESALSKVDNTLSGAQANGHISYYDVLKMLFGEPKSTNKEHTPLFKIEFDYLSRNELPEVPLLPLPVVMSPYDFKLSVTNVNETNICLQIMYNNNLFLKERIEEMILQYEMLLDSATNNPKSTIITSLVTQRALNVLPKAHEPLDSTWRGSIQEHFAKQAQKNPDRLAIKYLDKSVTYGELFSRTNKLAHHLISKGIKPGDVVGLYGHRSPAVVVAIMGILTSGASYMMMDPAYPTERIRQCSDIAKPKAWVQILLPPEDLQEFLTSLNLVTQVTLPQPWEEDNFPSILSTYPDVQIGPEDVAVITFTSGSTGIPKGVMGRHKPLTHYYPWMKEEFGIREDDRFSVCSGIAHDPLQRDIFTPLFFGAHIYIPTQDDITQPGRLSVWFKENEINVSCFTPAIGQLLTTGVKENFTIPSLRLAFFVGDLLFKRDVIRLVELAPNISVINMYGSTETQRSVGYHKVDAKNIDNYKEVILAGKGMKGSQLILLNKVSYLSGVGEVAEIYVRSHHLAKGYVGLPEETEKKFIKNPFTNIEGDRLYRTGDLGRYTVDGNVECSGRADDQIKIRGFRIELGEISAAIGKYPHVKESVTIVREDKPGEKQLASYVVALNGTELDLVSIKSFLQSKLPHYMVPTFIIPLVMLPLTPNGKINRAGLPAPVIEKVSENNLTPIQQKIIKIWSNLLGSNIPSLDTSFFEMGGHSILATRVTNEMKKEFNLDLSLTVLFTHPTVAEYAEILESRLQGKEHNKSNIDYVLETRLSDEIRLRSDIKPQANEINNVFLTGATGFLGAFLLSSLLTQNKKIKVYCLVRANNLEAGKQRIYNNLKDHGLWSDEYESRIVIALGDLSRESFGLDPKTWEFYADHMDIIIHNGAMVHWLQTYTALKPINVLGTVEVLKLACAKKVKSLHYVSTTNVFENENHKSHKIVYEDDDDISTEGLSGGYTQTKWVAEQLVRKARSRGIPCNIYRPGYVSGDAKKGVWNVDDFLCRLIKGCTEIGAAPKLDSSTLDMSPVDYVADSIIYLALNPTLKNLNFNITNECLYTYNEWFEKVKSYGYNLEILDYQNWRNLLQGAKDNALSPVLTFFNGTWADGLKDRTRYDTTNTKKYLLGSGITNKTIGDLMDTYFSYFIKCGFINPPEKPLVVSIDWNPKEKLNKLVRTNRT